MKNKLQTFNLTIGIAVFVVFVITGQLMRHYYHNAELPDVERLYRRSRHLFILMAALAQGGVGIYIQAFKNVLANRLQWTATLLMTASSIFLVLAFFFEIPTSIGNTPLSRAGLYLLLAGIGFHFFGFVLDRIRERRSQPME